MNDYRYVIQSYVSPNVLIRTLWVTASLILCLFPGLVYAEPHKYRLAQVYSPAERSDILTSFPGFLLCSEHATLIATPLRHPGRQTGPHLTSITLPAVNPAAPWCKLARLYDKISAQWLPDFSPGREMATEAESLSAETQALAACLKQADTRLKHWWQDNITYSPLFVPLLVVFLLLLMAVHVVTLRRSVKRQTRLLLEANKELRQQTLTDPLTQLYNRRYITDLMEKRRFGPGSLAVMIVDIDNFKQINDKYGHNTGDKVIAKVASIIRSKSCNNMVIARIGGEEFGILASGLEYEKAIAIGESMCRAVARERVFSDEVVCHISVSIGCAYYVSVPNILTFRDADRLMYQAKENGKNQLAYNYYS